MDLGPEERAILEGARGEAAKRALEYQVEVGRFWGARRFVPVTNVHMMGDMEVMGDAGLDLLRDMAAKGVRVSIPTTTNARCVDFGAAERLLQDPDMVAKERKLVGYLREMRVMLTDTCINYQTVYQPHFGEHVAWGDTGTVIYANSVLGARSNFESGPAAVAAAITGRTPSGSLTAEMWMESPMSVPSRSTVINSGIALARQRNSTSWRTIFSTPPRLMPGDLSSLTKWTGTSTVTSVSAPTRRKSTWIGKSRTGSSW